MFEDLANELKTAREKSSMTLAHVANKSKIDIKFIDAMERGDFAFLPDLYVRAFVKNFARTVGLDENKVYKKFEAAKQGVPYVEEVAPPKEVKVSPSETATLQKPIEAAKDKPAAQIQKPQFKKKDSLFTFDSVGVNSPAQNATAPTNTRNLIIGGSLLSVILLFALVYFLFLDKGDQIIVVEKPIEDVIQQNQRYVENNDASAGDESNVGVSDSLVLSINANDTSWIKVSVDERSSEEFILLPNSQKTIKAKTNYKITFGNSGAIKMQLNNKPLTFSGRSRAVLNILIDTDGVKYLENTPAQR